MWTDDPVIIEARCNESAYREANAHVPYSPEEIVEDAVRCWEAGASIFHWHGRDPSTGVPRNDLELYLEVYQGIRERTDLLIHPTLGFITQDDVADRLRHVLEVENDPALRVDMAPVDFGSINVDMWDPEKKEFVTEDSVYINSRRQLRQVLTALNERSVPVSSACWDVGQVRTALCFREAGLLEQLTIWELVFTGQTNPSGMIPSPAGLTVMLDTLPDSEPWMVMCWNGDVMPLAAAAVAQGGHVGVGLGDFGYRHMGGPTNGSLVERMSRMCESLGRRVATPGDAREILGIQHRGGPSAAPVVP